MDVLAEAARIAALRLAPPPPPGQAEVFARIGYSPTERQWEFHRSREYDVLYGGAAGGGKTAAIVAHMLWAAYAFPGLRIACFRRTYDELRESVIPELAKRQFGDALGGRWNAQESEVRFSNGSLIRLRYLETLQDASRRQGGEYQLICFEERSLLPAGAADLVTERLRVAVGTRLPVLGIRSTSNPGGASHAEVKARYIVATRNGTGVAHDDHGHSIRYIPARVDDNPHVDPGYRARLEAIPDPQRRAAMLDGSWDVFSGQVFSEWRHDRHVVRPWTLPESWSRWQGIDYGLSAPFAAVWVALDEDGRGWVYRELYQAGVGADEQARRILAAEAAGQAQGVGDDGSVITVPEPQPHRVADPAMAAKRDGAASILTVYAEAGVHAVPAVNDRLAGWARVHEFLADGPACPQHRALGWEACPRLHVFEGCTELIRTLPALPYDAHRVEDVDTHAEDHAPDGLRYALMAAGRGAAFFIADEVPETPQRGMLESPDDELLAEKREIRTVGGFVPLEDAGWNSREWEGLF